MKKAGKIALFTLAGIVTAAILVVIYCVLSFGAAFFGWFSFLEPKPSVQYGEFPFRITYEIDGETKVIEDTIICEFDGFSHSEAGTSRRWKNRLKSGESSAVLYRTEKNGLPFAITLPAPGASMYYMGDYSLQSKEEYEKHMHDDRYLWYEWQEEDGTVKNHSVEKEEVWEKYHLRVISVETSPPIENTFK